jgi:hypothetical protein
MTTIQRARRRRLASVLVAGLLLAGCDAGETPRNELRFTTPDFTVRVSPETRPTRALEPIYWRIVVHDRETGKPIQGGQGRIFATNRDRKTVSNGLEETGELGTYRSNLMFVTAGMWAMAIQFRRDSTQALQRTQDWTQDILTADEPGDFSTPRSSRVPDTAAARRPADSAGSTRPPTP